MRVSLRQGATLLFAGTALAAASAAAADELLVMPYACAVLGGRPVLTPSQDQGHRIIGAREHRMFTACSPVNPEACRQWTVHRFELDCGGVRVPWTAIVAGAQGNGRAWLEDGRLRLRMPAQWSFAPDDPCARTYGYDERWRYGRLGRYCADRRALSPPPIVEMPVGFAPMLGIDGVFVAARAPGAMARSGATPSAAAPTAKAIAPKVARAESPNDPPPPHRAAPAKEVPPAKQTPPTPPESAPAPPVAQSPVPSPPGQIAPKIVNRTDPASSATPSTPPPATELPKSTAPSPDVPGVRFGAPQVPTAAMPQAATPIQGAANPIEVNLISLLRGSALPAALAVTGLATLVFAGFAFLRQRERTGLVVVGSRDIASVSLDVTDSGRELIARAIVPQATASPQQVQTLSSSATSSMRPTLGDAIPRNRAEAYDVLGLGVAPDATGVAIKKIVDGLRLSWHPDHAHNPSDRKLRELRLKQINAAWEILAGKRVDA